MFKSLHSCNVISFGYSFINLSSDSDKVNVSIALLIYFVLNSKKSSKCFVVLRIGWLVSSCLETLHIVSANLYASSKFKASV